MSVKYKQNSFLISTLLTLFGILALLAGIGSLVNTFFNTDWSLEVYEIAVELPDDYAGSIALLTIGIIILGIGLILGKQKVHATIKQHKWIPFLVLLAFLGTGFYGLRYINVMSMGGQALAAAQTNDVLTLEKLYKTGKIKSSGRDLLELAVYYKSNDVVDLLIRQGVNTNQLSSDGNPIIFLAVRSSQYILNSFVNAKTDLKVKNRDKETVLMALIQNSEFNESEITMFVKLLIQSGLDIRARNIKGESAYHIAKSLGYSELARILQ